MAPHRPDRAPAPPDPLSPAMGALLAEAWRRGALAPPAVLSGPARAELAGVGERFAAWRVVQPGRPSLIIRIPHVSPDELHQDLDRELAALALLPDGVGPAPVAVRTEAGDDPLGHPWVVTTDVPGTALDPGAWTAAHLHAHAEHLALLHTAPAPGRGPLSTGEAPWRAVPTGTPRLLPEVEAELGALRARHGDAVREHGLAPLLEAALKTVSAAEGEIAQLDGFVLAHGDLCATNILWEDGAGAAPRVRFIDFEWAQGDDPARDLSSLGGPVHGGPWYVPMTEQQVAVLVRDYVRARRRHGAVPASVADEASLRERMRAWAAYERSAMLVHVASRAATSAAHRRVLPVLRGTLAAALGVGS